MATFVETWKCIAVELSRSERWWRYMAQRSYDPLPVFKVGGIVRLNLPDLANWLAHQREQCMAQPAGSAKAAAPHLQLIG